MTSALSPAHRVCKYRYADLFYIYAYRLYSTVTPKNTTLQKATTPRTPSQYKTSTPRTSSQYKRTSPPPKKSKPNPRNLQPHRAKLGPKPQKKNIPKNPQKSPLSLLEAIKKDINDKQPLSKIRSKIFFALTIPSTPPALATELFQIALKYHIENNEIINGYLRILSDVQDLDAVLEVFQYLKRIQQRPQVIQYGFILKCWIGPKIMDMAQLDENFEQMKPLVPVERKEQLYATYLSVYAHKKNYKKVDAIIEQMRRENIKITHITYSEVLSALIKNNPSEEKINELLLKMDKDNVAPSRLICNNILNFYISTGQIEKALNTAEMMEKHGVPFYGDSFLPLIDGFRKAGILSGVLYILNEMISRKIPLSRSVYTSVIAAYGELKDMGAAIKIFETMKQGGVTPFAPTYNCLIKGYLNMDDLPNALNTLVLLKKDAVPPSTETYTQFIDYFRKKGDLDNALDTMQQMRNEKLPLNHVIYYTVITLAVKLHGYDERAQGLIHTMIQEKVTPNEYLFRSMLVETCKRGFGDSKIFEILDLMDSLKIKYNHHQLTPVLSAMIHSTPMRADLAWEVMRRAMLQRFDLKTLRKDLKGELKKLGLMHPVENGAIN